MLMLHEGIRLSSVSYNTQIIGHAIIFNPFIFAIPCRRPLIFRTMNSEFEISGCKGVGITNLSLLQTPVPVRLCKKENGNTTLKSL